MISVSDFPRHKFPFLLNVIVFPPGRKKVEEKEIKWLNFPSLKMDLWTVHVKNAHNCNPAAGLAGALLLKGNSITERSNSLMIGKLGILDIRVSRRCLSSSAARSFTVKVMTKKNNDDNSSSSSGMPFFFLLQFLGERSYIYICIIVVYIYGFLSYLLMSCV